MKLYFDIETIPTTNQAITDKIRAEISAPANYTKPESIAKWFEENAESAYQEKYRKTALDGLYGEIISIAWAVTLLWISKKMAMAPYGSRPGGVG